MDWYCCFVKETEIDQEIAALQPFIPVNFDRYEPDSLDYPVI